MFTDKLFCHYRNGKCARQIVSINTLGNLPRIISSNLKLDNHAEGYIDEFISNKIEISNKIIREIHHNIQLNETIVSEALAKPKNSITFRNCTITNLHVIHNCPQ